jgi:DNA-binding MurR/RpiR family transcriptional regulator
VLLAASVEPYARATIDGARYAAGQGVPVVALTDSEVSPLTQIAAATILVATDSPSFLHTMTPLLAVAEILAALVAGRGGNKALAALEHTEAQLSTFGVHLPRRGAREKA